MRKTAYIYCKHCGKRAYRTEREAERALDECRHKAQHMRRAGVPGIRRRERRVYECEWTGFYHTTSMRRFDTDGRVGA